jgi:galactitol-specific phosphotransferase system IIB component
MATSPPRDIDEFTRAILVADGYGVATSDPLYNRIRELVAQAFIDHQSRSVD